jgi:hypothetical protein
LTEPSHKARAGQVVAGALEAIAITRKIRLMTSAE